MLLSFVQEHLELNSLKWYYLKPIKFNKWKRILKEVHDITDV